jgi:uncharacterized protein YecE (DUF72 family)
MDGNVLIGPAGWAYKDWEGIVYPPGLKRSQHPAEYLAQFFDLIEINTSFYAPVKPEHAKLWCRKVAPVNPDFKFTAKLYKSFTHAPGGVVQSTSAATLDPTDKDEDQVREGFDVLAAEGKLGAVLVQFPISFRNTLENRDYLELLIRRFIEYPLVVEIRHDSWNNENILLYFVEKGVSFCNIDQPALGQSIRPTEHVTAPIAYVRLHGRNYEQWFEHEHAHDRYNYLYSTEELTRWKNKVENISKKADVTFVVANNHFEGKAAVNSLQLRHMLTGEKVRAPEPLVQHYPQQLRSIVDRTPGEFALSG